MVRGGNPPRRPGARDPGAGPTRIGELGFWQRSLGGAPVPREPLPGPVEVDVAIVGAGYTGLWTGWYLKRAEPSLEIAVIEAAFAGFGASGRNGGWVMGLCEGRPEVYEKGSSPEAVRRLYRELSGTVDEIGRVLAEERIEADFHKGGGLMVAIGDAQAERQAARAALDDPRSEGSAVRLLDAGELSERLRIAGARSALFRPDIARVHPAKLVRGLAEAVERLGVRIYESTPVGEIRPHLAVTERGEVKARWVVRATEAYTAGLVGQGRKLAPVASSMIVTEPLDDATWAEIGWEGMETVGDEANLFVYLQRTADGRIAIGGREGVSYRFGSETDFGATVSPATVEALQRRLTAMFPALGNCRIEHGWTGVIGVPRDWCVSVDADPKTGLAHAGGYSGEGVGSSNLAGRILTDLLLERRTGLTDLPWVGRQSPSWEPEPFRLAGIRSIYGLYRLADGIERRTGHPSRFTTAVNLISGRG
ncbi:MAG: FAD-binding oxidoreductase [Solirubrobacterales bacterium]|nr:FAD-binding oxidoreductase [Solirubrobacterales bacterium]